MEKNRVIIHIVFLLASFMVKGQTGIGVFVPNENAMLEVYSEDKGILIPRLNLQSALLPAPLTEHEAGMIVYNTSDHVPKGFYYNDGSKWQQMITTDYKPTKFFYMPAITIDTSEHREDVVLDLYDAYKKQFALQGNYVKSSSAPGSSEGGIPFFTSATDLYYYVTDYDPAVFTKLEISDEGVMKYTVEPSASECTILNIVFVVK